MLNCTTIKPLVVFLTLWLSSLAAEKNIILRALTATSNDSIRKARDVNGPSIPVTQKPSCPSFITCPYPPYPRPTTKRPLTTHTISSSSSHAVVEYFGPGNHMDESISPTSETENKPDFSPTIETENKPDQSIAGSEPGNIQGPSISATSKPPCPSYITCPYPPYPRPTTASPQVQSVTKPSANTIPEKLVVEALIPEKESTSENPPSSSESNSKLDEFRESKPAQNPPIPAEKTPSDSESNSKPDVLDSVKKTGNAQGPSISATSKPPCPSYITCPYPPYPRPTTKPPQEDSVTTPSTNTVPDKLIVDYIGPEKEDTPEKTPIISESNSKPDVLDNINKPGNAQGPSISATSKPPCPGYITCPYPPYPRPTTKPPQEDSVTTPSTNSDPDKSIVDYIGPEKENMTDKTPVVSESNSKPDVLDSVSKPGNAQGPSISATSKPPCPSYITCPYPPYPRPTTKPPQEDSVTTPSTNTAPDKLIVDYIGPEKEDTPDKTPVVSESNSKPDVLDNVNKPGNIQGPSISATTKPPCPGYITCPYPPYPRPTTKPPQEDSVTTPSTNTVPDKLIVDYIGPEKEDTPEKTPVVSESNSKPDVSANVNKPGNAQGPSISATSKPPCPSYISCPYPSYPRPTTKNPLEDIPASLRLSTVDKTIVEYIEPDTTTSPEDLQSIGESSPSPPAATEETEDSAISFESNAIDPLTLNNDSENEQPNPVHSETTISNIFSTTKKVDVESLESETRKRSVTTESSGEWPFPESTNGKINSAPPSSDSTSNSQDHNLLEYQSDALYLSRGPAISATQSPRCSFYAPCPYIYPKPTTASPILSNRFSFTSTSHSNSALSPSNNPLLHRNPSNVDPFFAGNGAPIHPVPQDPVVLGNQGAFLPIYSYVYGIDPYAQNAYYYNRRPVLLTQQPFWPSYLKNPWIYPRPIGSDYVDDQEPLANSNQSNEDVSSDNEEEDENDGDNENVRFV